ncbi:MAG: polysaccharide-degrading enzyme [Planctomycetota bacterium]|nr:MAG: polysaccharide-degrading enzyme [Planctomycetota bacterium]REJ86480.1 MAG: polysaccharide-degrading enzyme [Planctomycetota bacterium]REK28070.1 MAG: polysaccharide-degrading enzyme [Planctomycetota bacterium]REK37597.1 MAG: polysaccharide-degrading enzyme [Planctomycetota bacterium]
MIVFSRPLLTSLAAIVLCTGSFADDYHVGPEQPLTTPDQVPWESLGPGDRVLIHHRPRPYHAKWVLCCRGAKDEPIVVSGVPGPDGELPVLDAKNAISRPGLDFWSGERGVIKIGGAGFAPELTPAHIIIENLDIRGARPGRSFVSGRGIQQYAEAASAIFVERAEYVTIRNCDLHDCANGFFTAHETSEISVQRCRIYGNGIEDSYYQHNVYTESAGIVFEHNYIGPLRENCPGNNLKDRSSGLVVRYNWIEGGNRQLDLVDAEDSERIRHDPRYDAAYVYGNVLIELDDEGNNQIVHFGGDSGAEAGYRKGPLYFYNNTVVSRRPGNTTLLRLSTNDTAAWVFNNVLSVQAAGDRFAILDETGFVQLTHNLLQPGWKTSHGVLTGAIQAEENVPAETIEFLDDADQDYHLAPGSPGIDAGGGEIPDQHPLLFEPDRATKLMNRRAAGSLDAGAFETRAD